MLYAIFVRVYPVWNTLASSTISTFLSIACNRMSNPHPNLIETNVMQCEYRIAMTTLAGASKCLESYVTRLSLEVSSLGAQLIYQVKKKHIYN